MPTPIRPAAPPVLAGRLDALGHAGLQVGVAARAGQRIGALHVAEQLRVLASYSIAMMAVLTI
jgi:hypothetical protein